jgi:ABC-type transport system involved in Fe-S cluster assembly fused permease/ATPase subunit
MDKVLKAVLKRQIPFIIGGTITGIIVTYYYGFLFSIIVNSAIWMFISFIVNKYYYKSTGFKMRNILCNMHYQSLILGQEEFRII